MHFSDKVCNFYLYLQIRCEKNPWQLQHQLYTWTNINNLEERRLKYININFMWSCLTFKTFFSHKSFSPAPAFVADKKLEREDRKDKRSVGNEGTHCVKGKPRAIGKPCAPVKQGSTTCLLTKTIWNQLQPRRLMHWLGCGWAWVFHCPNFPRILV